MSPNIYITNLERVELVYEIPRHLQGIEDTSQLREVDLELLRRELKENGSSLDEKISSGAIWRMDFPRMVVDVSRLDYDGRNAQLTVSPIHPHRADLSYKRDETLPRNVAPLTANALLQSAEGSFVLGIREGDVASGKIGIIPGGHTDYGFPLVTNPLDTLRSEFEEELGYNFGVSGREIPLRAVFTDRNTQGMNVLYTARTDLAFPQILEKWKGAKDRWEHSSLFQATQEDIKQLAETGELDVEGKRYSTPPIFQDCFRIISSSKMGNHKK